jgi:hypothetical protein
MVPDSQIRPRMVKKPNHPFVVRALARESHQSISGLLTEVLSDYVRERRLRPVVMDHLEDSIRSRRSRRGFGGTLRHCDQLTPLFEKTAYPADP